MEVVCQSFAKRVRSVVLIVNSPVCEFPVVKRRCNIGTVGGHVSESWKEASGSFQGRLTIGRVQGRGVE